MFAAPDNHLLHLKSSQHLILQDGRSNQLISWRQAENTLRGKTGLVFNSFIRLPNFTTWEVKMNRYQRYKKRQASRRAIRETLRRFDSRPQNQIRLTIPIWVWLPYLILWGMVIYLLCR